MTKVSKYHTSPINIEDGDWSAIKVVAVAGFNNDWAAYWGPSDWPDERVKAEGIKLSENEAGVFAWLMQLRDYR